MEGEKREFVPLKAKVKRTKLESFQRTLYHPEKKTVCGKTPKDWCLLLVYYIVYYCILSAMFVGLLVLHLNVFVKENVPYLSGEQSLMRFNPGLASIAKSFEDTSLIKVNSTHMDNATRGYYVSVNDTLFKYVDFPSQYPDGIQDCKVGTSEEKMPELNLMKPCGFAQSILGDCGDYQKQTAQRQPCIFLKMNKIFGWMPQPYSKDNKTLINNSNDTLIECRGEKPGDTENMGKVSYSPHYKAPDGKKYGRISQVYYPYIGQTNFQNPLVAVQLKKIKPHVLVMIKCYVVGIKTEEQYAKFQVIVD